MIKLALLIATAAHAGQYSKYGDPVPYIVHPVQVAQDEDLFDELDKVVALLHDVPEDSPEWLPIIKKVFPREVVNTLTVLTHTAGDSYADYVNQCRMYERPRRVKIADVKNNLSRTLKMPESLTRERLLKKYTLANDILFAD